MTMDKGSKKHETPTHHFLATNGQTVEIRDVWAANLDEEMEKIREIIEKYPFVAMVRSCYPLQSSSTYFIF
jgi:hypothetical protein